MGDGESRNWYVNSGYPVMRVLYRLVVGEGKRSGGVGVRRGVGR